jgi:hypothetical protein
MKSRKKKNRSKKGCSSSNKQVDGVSPKKILKAAGGVLLLGSVLPTSLPSTSVQSIPLISPDTPASFSVPTPSMMKTLKSNSLEFLKMYKRLDLTRKEIKSRITTPPKGYTEIEKQNDSILLHSIEDLFDHHKSTLALHQQQEPSEEESSCCIA